MISTPWDALCVDITQNAMRMLKQGEMPPGNAQLCRQHLRQVRTIEYALGT